MDSGLAASRRPGTTSLGPSVRATALEPRATTEKMNLVAPSLTALLGERIGARLISHAGSLTNLSKYPASTVQILGAEKALFRALKTKGNTPKVRSALNTLLDVAYVSHAHSMVSCTTPPISAALHPSSKAVFLVFSLTNAPLPHVSTAIRVSSGIDHCSLTI